MSKEKQWPAAEKFEIALLALKFDFAEALLISEGNTSGIDID